MAHRLFTGSWLEKEASWRVFPVKQPDPAVSFDSQAFVNSLGIRMIPVGPASFEMGGGDLEKCPDGLPVHTVTLTEPFWIAEVPVTRAQFEQFWLESGRPVCSAENPADIESWRGYALGLSYYDAADFTMWLSEKEGIQYRLPTEAEWEYAARHSRELDVDRMCDAHLREWCLDWYSPYDDEERTDPCGPDSGEFKVVRGGYLDDPGRYNEEPLELWMRCALPPSFRHAPDSPANSFGRHFIGMRLVCGALPKAYRQPQEEVQRNDPASLVSLGVHQETACYVHQAPDAQKPYFRKRYLFPVPPDNASSEEIIASGFPASFRHHHHSPGFTFAPNGDLIVSIYSTYHEYDAEAGLAGGRLRKGCDEWEMPDIFLNPVGVNDHAPSMFTDTDGTIYHFWGWQQLKNSYPFQYAYSKDNGETWSGVQFPVFTKPTGPVERQPVNTCIRAKDGTFYMVSDSKGASSVLWRTKDMQHWEDPMGRTAGRHTTAVELKDGSILCMGGKNSDIDGHMPKAVTFDGGETFTVSKTPFPALNSGQRPCIARLRSGKLVMCGDYLDKLGRCPLDIHERNSYAAWSDDEGETWHFRPLWGAQQSKNGPEGFGGSTTIGYSALRQSPDGMIHIIATNIHPLLHFEFNEAWLTSEETHIGHADGSIEVVDRQVRPVPREKQLMESQASGYPNGIQDYTEYYENGTVRLEYHGGIADDGRFLLEGTEKEYYPDGSLRTEGVFHLGKRVDHYVYYDRQGHPFWRWDYEQTEEGGMRRSRFTTYFSGCDQVRTSCPYLGKMADGTARTYDRSGKVLKEVTYSQGKIISRAKLNPFR